MSEETQNLVQDVIAPFKTQGLTEIEDQIIKLPLKYDGPLKIDPMDYEMSIVEQSSNDYLADYDGVCMLGVIYMTPKKILVRVAFKNNGDKSPYKIII